MTIAKTLQKKRLSLGITQGGMASRLGISSQLYGFYERNQRQPKVEFYNKWHEVFGENLLTTNVSRETLTITDTNEKTLGDIQERLIRIEAHLEVFESAIAGLQSKTKSDFMNKVGGLRTLVTKAYDRRFSELGKKSL